MSVGTTSKESARKSTARYAKANGSKLRAKWAVQSAVRSGKLKKPSKCPKCGRTANLQFHHTDKSYSKESRLKGVWRCRQCHVKDDSSYSSESMRRSMKNAKSNK